ncbi:MAG: hypothetical protein H7Y38_12000 [Armatimonadetes bacterium]|nr:hypothetical protein [Armatimonadota bacterium]
MATIVVPTSSHAILVYGDQDYNLVGNQNEFAQVGLQYAGIVVGGTNGYATFPDGTYKASNVAWPISPNWALRANHTTGGYNDGYEIAYGGTLHSVLETRRIGNSDLTLIRVDQPFTSYAKMFDPSLGNEVDREVVMIGATGIVKDHTSPFTTNNGTFMNGWNRREVAPNDVKRLNWGRNQIESILANVENTQVLYTTFDKATLDNGTPNPRHIGSDEANTHFGDSGGGVFIKQNGEWRLAGVNLAVDAVYRTQTSSEYVLGGIYDARNLWGDFYIDENNPQLGTVRRIITGSDPVPLGNYASRVAGYRTQIDNMTGQTRGLGAVTVPEAGTAPLALLGIVGGAFAAFVRRHRAD